MGKELRREIKRFHFHLPNENTINFDLLTLGTSPIVDHEAHTRKKPNLTKIIKIFLGDLTKDLNYDCVKILMGFLRAADEELYTRSLYAFKV